MELIELDESRILKRLGYTSSEWRVFLVKGIGYVGACEIITEGQGAFGQSGRAVMVIKNFIKFCRKGHVSYSVPAEYLIKRIPNAKITDKNILTRITNALKYEIVDCEECGGGGFSKPGTGYDAVCDNCGGLGRYPK